MAWYYTFNPPSLIGGDTCTKPGITLSPPIGRLGKYQLPYGPCWEAHYSWLCYHQDPEIIKWIEGSVLGQYRYRSPGIGPGMTEWLADTTWQEIREYVLMICRDNQIEIVDYGPGPWNPVRIQKEIKSLDLTIVK
jgi:hypothetical protein